MDCTQRIFLLYRLHDKIEHADLRPIGALAVMMLSAVFYWSDFVSPVLYLYQTKWYTLPIGLQLLKQLDLTNWPLLMVGATIMTLPIVILFLMLQRSFLSDLSLANLIDRE